MKKHLFLLMTFISFNSQADDIIPNYFKATYDGFYEGKKVGQMIRVFKKEGDDYVIISNSKIKGKYGFIPITDNRNEISRFKIDNEKKFHPKNYQMDRTGTWIDFVMKADFDYESNKIHMTYKDRESTKDIVGNVLDNALYQLRFQHEVKNKRKEIKYDIAYKTGFKGYHFIYEKNENIDMYGNQVNLMKFKQVRKNKNGEKKAAFSWVDPQRDFIMTQFIYYNEKGKETARFKLKDYQKL